MKEFLISDTHFGHGNIIKYDNRPFASTAEHDEKIIEGWNSVVSKDDLVYHLGDVCLCAPARAENILSRLNGKIILIEGNHDKSGVLKPKLISRFESVHIYYELHRFINETEKVKIILMHYPLESWKTAHIHFHGHSHGSTPKKPRRIDVGCHLAHMQYKPIELFEAIKMIKDEN